MDIAAWLRDLGLERYIQAFEANDVDAAVLARRMEDAGYQVAAAEGVG